MSILPEAPAPPKLNQTHELLALAVVLILRALLVILEPEVAQNSLDQIFLVLFFLPITLSLSSFSATTMRAMIVGLAGIHLGRWYALDHALPVDLWDNLEFSRRYHAELIFSLECFTFAFLFIAVAAAGARPDNCPGTRKVVILVLALGGGFWLSHPAVIASSDGTRMGQVARDRAREMLGPDFSNFRYFVLDLQTTVSLPTARWLHARVFAYSQNAGREVSLDWKEP